MKLLENDQNILLKEKLDEIVDQIDPQLKYTEKSEVVLLEFINEYIENLMHVAMDLESIKKVSKYDHAQGVDGQGVIRQGADEQDVNAQGGIRGSIVQNQANSINMHQATQGVISTMAHGNLKQVGNLPQREVFSDESLLDIAKELLDRRGLSYNNIRKV